MAGGELARGKIQQTTVLGSFPTSEGRDVYPHVKLLGA